MNTPEQADVFSKRIVSSRGPMLQIFRPDQASLPEEEQRPSITVEIDTERKAAQCLWVSREPVHDAIAKASRTIGRKRSIEWKSVMAGFRGLIDNVSLGYEGEYGQSWSPRFWCNIEEGTFPIHPLSQLIAATVFERGFPQRTVEGLISDFMSNSVTVAA